MKTTITFAISVLISCLLPAASFAQNTEKIYQITAEGKHQFIYVRDLLAGNGIIHPITARTFYLETKRRQLIPESVSYNAFLQYPGWTLQAMLDAAQQEMIATAMNRSTGQDVGVQPPAFSSGIFRQETIAVQDCTSVTEPLQADEDLSEETNSVIEPLPEPSWITRAITEPGSEDIPGFVRKYGPVAQPLQDNPSVQAHTDIPWIVQVMLMEGDTPYENRYAVNNSPTLTENDGEKRMRLQSLVQSLLKFSDDIVQEAYGKVFPGMNGKLYGSSDAELDELVQALLNLKEEILASSKPEIQHIYNEFEMLALGR